MLHSCNLILSAAMEHFFASAPQRVQEPWCSDASESIEIQLTVPVEDFLIHSWDWSDLWENVRLSLVAYDDLFPDTLSGSVCICWLPVSSGTSDKLKVNDTRQPLPSSPALSHFLRGGQSLQILEFVQVKFKEEHCRALATLRSMDLAVKFHGCIFEPQDAEGILIEWFRNNQVVTEVFYCEIGSSMISALSGNYSVKRLSMMPHYYGNYVDQIRSLVQALPGNMGIEHLTLNSFTFTDERWGLLFRSLSMHPRLKCLCILSLSTRAGRSLSVERKATRMNAILRMLQRNTVVSTIDLPYGLNDEEMYQNSILPRLEMNRTCFEVQRQAVTQADPAIRSQLFGRALHVIQYNPNLVFLFLSENVPAFVRSVDAD
jgi:hypothetical protein